MNETELIRIADALSTKSDRWLFIATLVILLMVGVYAFRFLITHLASVSKEYKDDRLMFQTALRQIIQEQAMANQVFKEAIQANTVISQENNVILKGLERRGS